MVNSGKLTSLVRQFFKFALVGLSNTLISLGVYSLLVYSGVHYQIGNVSAFIISSLNGYILNKFWVFNAHTEKKRIQMVKYYIVYCGSLLISMILSFVWIDILQINQYASPMVNLLITVPLNYLLSRKWIYVNRKPEKFCLDGK